MRYVLCLLLGLAATANAEARNGAFLGGWAEGASQAQELENQRRALELDPKYGTSHYDRMRREKMERLIEENNRLLREQERRRVFGF